MPEQDLDRLVAAVVADHALTTRLAAIRDRADFVRAMTELAADRGLVVGRAEVEDALRAARRTWLERWV